MRRIHLSAVILGLAVYAGIYALRAAYGDHLVASGLLERRGPGGLIPLTWLSALVWTVPAFTAGWLARSRGGAHGVLVAALGISIEYGFTAIDEGIIKPARLWSIPMSVLGGWIELLGVALILGFVAGVAGMVQGQR